MECLTLDICYLMLSLMILCAFNELCIGSAVCDSCDLSLQADQAATHEETVRVCVQL